MINPIYHEAEYALGEVIADDLTIVAALKHRYSLVHTSDPAERDETRHWIREIGALLEMVRPHPRADFLSRVDAKLLVALYKGHAFDEIADEGRNTLFWELDGSVIAQRIKVDFVTAHKLAEG